MEAKTTLMVRKSAQRSPDGEGIELPAAAATSESVSVDLGGANVQDARLSRSRTGQRDQEAKEQRLKPHVATNWSTAEAEELYGIRTLSAGYFDLSADGSVGVSVPFNGRRARVSLLDIVAGMQQRGLQMPVLLRIENILDAQLSVLNESFAQAMKALSYRARYRGVFPIKVNQQCHVIEEIARFGERYGHGL